MLTIAFRLYFGPTANSRKIRKKYVGSEGSDTSQPFEEVGLAEYFINQTTNVYMTLDARNTPGNIYFSLDDTNSIYMSVVKSLSSFI